MKTVELFSDLKKIKVKTIYDTFRIILYCYIVGIALLFLILLYFVYSSKSMFNTFLNFVGIVPVKYLMEDEQLYKDVLRLEQHIF
jgi:ABC-type polysaccharide transport system permease subunit